MMMRRNWFKIEPTFNLINFLAIIIAPGYDSDIMLV